MYCPSCGKPNEDGSVFCEHCGASLLSDADEGYSPEGDWGERAERAAEPPSGGDDEKSGGKRVVVIAIVAAVVVVAAIVVGVLAAGAGEGDEGAAQTTADASPDEGDEGAAQTTADASPDEAQEAEPEGSQSEEASEPEDRKILFETSGGTTYEPMEVRVGDVVTSPTEPTKNNAVFEGWYSDQGLTVQASFPYTVKDADPEAIVFYAKWRVLDGVYADGPGMAASYAGDGYLSDYTNCIFPYSSSEYLTEPELAGLTDQQIQRAINEIYARNGYIFQKSAEEKAFFEAQSWYYGNETDESIVQLRFNDIERANVRLLTSYR